jgi:putative restriction endonuclease
LECFGCFQTSLQFHFAVFHLKSEPFWRLSFTHPKASSLKSISTINVLKDFVAFAELDEALFQLMLDVPINYYLESFLLDFYFPETKALYKASKGDVYDLEAVIKNEIVNETGAVYSQKINEMQEVMTEVELEEDRFIRGGIFKREVPRLYNHTCCISGMKIETSIQAQWWMLVISNLLVFQMTIPLRMASVFHPICTVPLTEVC